MTDSQPVTLTLWDQAPYLFVEDDLPESVIDECVDACRYEVEGHEHTNAWREGRWNGFDELFRKNSRGTWMFPIGLLAKVTRILDLNGIDYQVEGLSRPGRGDVSYAWDSDMTMRPYQQEVIDDALRRGAGVIAAPTGSGKTALGIRLIYELKREAVVTVHLKEVADQWVDDLESILDVEVGRYYGGERDTDAPVVVALYQSMTDGGAVRQDAPLDRGVFLADECHRVGSDLWGEVALSISAPYRFGLSATPERSDNAFLKVVGGTGPLIADLSVEELIDDGYLAEPRWELLEAPRVGGRFRNWQDEYKAKIVQNDARNEMLAEAIDDAPKPCLATVEHVNHGERIESLIESDVAFVHGSSSTRDEDIQRFRDGELDVLLATRGIVGEGFNVPQIECFVICGGLKSKVSVLQQVGRALRPSSDTAKIIDVMDDGEYVGRHSEERLRTYRDYYKRHGP